MNLSSLEERCWEYLGKGEASMRLDFQRQQIRDALNEAQLEAAVKAPFHWDLVREGTIPIVVGTKEYTLDDWCLRPISFWTEGTTAHPVKLRHPYMVDRDGSRNTSHSYISNGPYEVVLIPRSTTAARSGTAASASEAATSVTGCTGASATDIGRMLTLNGEDGDYLITATNTSSYTVDKTIRARLTGRGVTGAGAGYTSVPWAVGPTGRFRVKILQSPTEAGTLYYRYVRYPRRMINTTDRPELHEVWHRNLIAGALSKLSALVEDKEMYSLWKQEWMAALDEIAQNEPDDLPSEDVPDYVTLLDCPTTDYPRDIDLRNQRY